jgi:hypothetical protein
MISIPQLTKGILLALTAIGLFLLTFGTWKMTDELMFASQAEVATGKVVNTSEGKAMVSFQVEKQDAGNRKDEPNPIRKIGQINRYQGWMEAVHFPALEKGEEVEVLFRPENPRDARLGGFWQRYSNPAMSLAAGVLLGCLVVPAWMKQRRAAGGLLAPPLRMK